jgi:hypothetical protein
VRTRYHYMGHSSTHTTRAHRNTRPHKSTLSLPHLVELFLALGNLLRRHTTLGKVNVPLLLVHTENHHALTSSDTQQLLDRSDTST